MSIENNSQEQITNLKSLAGSIAHETKNPLSAIKSCCAIVKDNLSQAMEFIDLISLSSDRGLQIIDMILVNIREGEIDKNKFVQLSMANVVKKAIKEYAFESQTERLLVKMKLDKDFIFKGDETLMIFVLFNLLKNALCYKGEINITLDEWKDNNVLYFSDYGVGIEKEKLPNIFDSFFTSDKKGGTGLGLPFCKRIMQAFGGDTSCKSVRGEYTSFTLYFLKID